MENQKGIVIWQDRMNYSKYRYEKHNIESLKKSVGGLQHVCEVNKLNEMTMKKITTKETQHHRSLRFQLSQGTIIYL